MQGGLTTLDQDYGIFHKLTHDIGTHVVHHLVSARTSNGGSSSSRNCVLTRPPPRCPPTCAPQFPQMPHYHLTDATEAVKPVMGPYYREPVKSPGPIPTHLWGMLKKSFENDHYVEDTGDIVYYQKDARI